LASETQSKRLVSAEDSAAAKSMCLDRSVNTNGKFPSLIRKQDCLLHAKQGCGTSSHSSESQYEMSIHGGIITIFQQKNETDRLPEVYSGWNFASCRREPCSNLLTVTANRAAGILSIPALQPYLPSIHLATRHETFGRRGSQADTLIMTISSTSKFSRSYLRSNS
jgi:hypothetical protein